MSDLSRPRILIVDDEAPQVRALCETLDDNGYQTFGFTEGSAAIEAMREPKLELILADLMMPGLNGLDVLRAGQKLDPSIVGIIMTGEGTIASAVEAMRSGALDFIQKPFTLSVVLPVLARALAVRNLRVANAELERSVREYTLELETKNWKHSRTRSRTICGIRCRAFWAFHGFSSRVTEPACRPQSLKCSATSRPARNEWCR